MPLYNFLSYKGKHHIVEPFPYPVTFTGVQMLVTGLFLACCNIILHAFKRQPSWIFGRGFLIKMYVPPRHQLTQHDTVHACRHLRGQHLCDEPRS